MIDTSRHIDNITEYRCPECGSTNTIVDEYNPEDWEGAGDAELAERELGNHGTFTCLDCGTVSEYDN
ncbi:hypothetical protein [Methanoregula sp. UBA64]|uniref:hypothetical protein n=1 Tax=Methanoregula sp. UBA64 TaxID=1915554 RepID=UPI0025D9902A|nr:hypothetical protein [Methanoregula sp. UBA64]